MFAATAFSIYFIAGNLWEYFQARKELETLAKREWNRQANASSSHA